MAMDKQKVSILVLLDLSAAFDTVNHSVLLERLSNRCGIRGEALKWFVSCLGNRFQMVKVKDEKSKQMPLSCGVPQGSVLGPLLFLVYTLPLGDIVRNRGMKFHLYADDTQLYLSFSPSPECMHLSIQQIEGCVQEIHSWMLTNKLKLNGDKTELLLIGTRKQCAKLPNLLINIGNTEIKPGEKARNLGAVFDANLSLKSHVNSLCSSARYYLYNIRLARKYLTKEAAEKAIHAFVTSRLDCNNSLLYGLPVSELQKLQKIQNSAARILTGANRHRHITPVLKQLHWLPITQRIKYKIIVLTYKCINNLAPKYLTELVTLRTAARRTRSTDDNLKIETPRTKLVTAGDRAFISASPHLWNKLPYALRATDSLETFKCRLKTHLFKEYFA